MRGPDDIYASHCLTAFVPDRERQRQLHSCCALLAKPRARGSRYCQEANPARPKEARRPLRTLSRSRSRRVMNRAAPASNVPVFDACSGGKHRPVHNRHGLDGNIQQLYSVDLQPSFYSPLLPFVLFFNFFFPDGPRYVSPIWNTVSYVTHNRISHKVTRRFVAAHETYSLSEIPDAWKRTLCTGSREIFDRLDCIWRNNSNLII